MSSSDWLKIMFGVSLFAYCVTLVTFFIYFYSEVTSFKKDIERMSSRLSGNAWSLFRLGMQIKFQKNLSFTILITSFLLLTPLVDLVKYWLTRSWSNWDMIDDICIGVLIVVWLGLSFILIFKNKEKFSLVFKRINSDAKFLREYHLTNDPYLDSKWGLVVDAFLSKIKKLNRREQQKQNLFAIYTLFSFYLDLLKVIERNKNNKLSVDKIIFANGSSQITIDEMLKKINAYFNSFELEIKTARALKFAKS